MIKEGDIVLCTVKEIQKTTVFVNIESNGEGSIVMSEIAAGRIRNLREYVTPNKKIVCKVLRIINGHPQLSLRRVTARERESILNMHKKEKTLKGMLKVITKNPRKVLEKIKTHYEIPSFIEEVRENQGILEKFLSKEEAEKLSKILEEKKEKDKISKKTFTLKSTSPAGLSDIKEILKIKDAKISYLGSSKFSIEITGRDFKETNQKVDEIIEQIEKKSKQKKAEFKLLQEKK